MATMFGTTVSATTNNENQGTMSTAELSINSAQISPEHYERMEEVMNGTADLKVGESVVATTFDDGTVLYVKVIDETNDAARTAQYNSRSFVFYTKNWLGNHVNSFKVTMECYWNEDGYDSTISNLVGTWTRYDNDFILSWNNGHSQSPTFHCMGLNIYHHSGNSYYIFDAIINILLDPPVCSIGYGAY